MSDVEMKYFGVAAVVLLMGTAVNMLLQGEAVPPSPTPPSAGKANFYGLVKNSVTGEALGGVSVTLNGSSTETNAVGYFEFLELEVGSYSATFSKSGYGDYTTDIVLTEGNNGYEVSLTPTTSFILEFPKVDLLGINGKGVSEQGVVEGVPYITLAEPIVADTLLSMATFSLYNKAVTLYSDNGYSDLAVQIHFTEIPLKVWGRAGITLVPGPEGYYNWKPAPFSYTVTPGAATNNASWEAGVHNALVHLGGKLWDQSGFWPFGAEHDFWVYNFIQCTEAGSVQVA